MKILIKKSLLILGSDVLVRLFGFISFAYIARISGNDIFGILNIGLAVLNYSVTLTSPGFHILGTKFISKNLYSDKFINNKITYLRFLLAALFVILLSIVFYFNNSPADVFSSVLLYSFSLIFISFQNEWFLQAKGKTEIINYGRILNALIFLVLIFFFYKTGNHWHIVPVSFLVSNFIQSIFVQFYSKKYFNTDTSNIISSFEIIKSSLPLGYSSIATQALLQLPVVFLGLLTSAYEVSLFSAALKLLFFILAVDRILYLIFFPIFSKFANDKIKLANFVNVLLSWIFIFGLSIIFTLKVNSSFILQLVYGVNFIPASIHFNILLIFFVSTLLNSVVGYSLIAIGNINRFSKITTTTSTILILLSPFVIYFFGGIGAALLLSVGEIIILTLLFFELNKNINLNIINGKLFIILTFVVLLIVFIPDGSFGLSLFGLFSILFLGFGFKILKSNDLITFTEMASEE